MEVQLRRNSSYSLFDAPNAFAAAAAAIEKVYLVCIRLRIIPIDKAQESALPGAIGTKQCPAFTPVNNPIDAR
jgi:hypothetical protein